MNYGIAEQEIADRINSKFAELNLSEKFFAAPMPDTDKEAQDFEAQIQKARAAIEFIDTLFQPNTSLGVVRQEEVAKFRLLFDAKKMRGPYGLLTMIDYVKKFLLGYKPTDGDVLTLAGYGKLQFEPTVWLPYLEFECKAINAQVYLTSEPVLGGVLTGITTPPTQFTEEFEETQFQ